MAGYPAGQLPKFVTSDQLKNCYQLPEDPVEQLKINQKAGIDFDHKMFEAQASTAAEQLATGGREGP